MKAANKVSEANRNAELLEKLSANLVELAKISDEAKRCNLPLSVVVENVCFNFISC